MDWLSAALWNLCMSMLPQRNTRALLVPLLCVAMLVPFSAAAGARREHSAGTESLGTTPTAVSDGHSLAASYVVTPTATASDGLPVQDHMVASVMALAQQTHTKGSAGLLPPSPSPPATPFGFDTKARLVGSEGAPMAAPGIELQPKQQRQQSQLGLPTKPGVVFLGKDSTGVVPRKFTIPEASVVANAEHKHIAMLPAKPHAAAAEEHRLIRRDMLERSGVSLADTMVVVTVDGSMYGVSRFDGAIIWRRDGFLESAAAYRSHPTCPREMVWTRSRPESFLAVVGEHDEMCMPLRGDTRERGEPGQKGHGWSEQSSERLGGDSVENFEAEDDEDDEEEWLLEQGIDWRSDPQVLELQRQRRREWLAKQRSRTQNHGGPVAKEPRGSFADSDSGSSSLPEVLYIAEPGGGGALYMYNAEIGLKKLPLTIQNLVDQSPVQVRGVLYTGNKEANFAAIDLASGRLLSIYGDERVEHSDDRATTSARFGARRLSIKLLLAEKLNRVRIYPADAGTGRFRQLPQWELYHRSVQAPALDPEIDALLAELSDAVEAQGVTRGDASDEDEVVGPRSHGPTKFVMTQDGGFVMIEATTGIPLWAQEFDSPVVSVFDVFGIATAAADGSGSDSNVNYVARRRDLSPAAQQSRYMRWRQLHEVDDEATATSSSSSFGFGKTRSQDSRWRTGSAGGNVLAGAFWERTGKTTTLPQIAYIGKLKDTLYTLTSDEFPLIDHASLLSSLLLSLAQAKQDQTRYSELQHSEWWDRWGFLTHDAVVLRVLQEARAWWLKPAASEGALALENRFEKLMDMVAQHHAVGKEPSVEDATAERRQICDDKGTCHIDGIIGIHPVEPLATGVLEVDGVPLHRPGIPGGEVIRESYEDVDKVVDLPLSNENQRPTDAAAAALLKEDAEDWPWWRYVGHYMTRVAAFIGYMVTITVFVAFVGALYLLRPQNKRRPRMWVDAEGDDEVQHGRRARLKISWALMHRMWATLKEEWRQSIEVAWRNPNAAAVLWRTGVTRRSPELDEAAALAQLDLSRQSVASASSGSVGQTSRRESASASALDLLLLGREDSELSSFDRLPSGSSTPRRNSVGAMPMTPLKRPVAEGDSIERLQLASPRGMPPPQVRLSAITLTDQVLGYGSHGTMVYRGEFQGRAVAVKRLLLDFYEVADHEVQVLQESDSHPNVIRYFCTERQEHFMYIALELCCGSLADAVSRASQATVASQLLRSISKKKVMYQLACGLHHLHTLKLVHRDIKPQNILIAPPPHRRRRRTTRPDASEPDELAFDESVIVAGGIPRLLISDFGLSRILDDDESSFANTFTMHGHYNMGNGAGGAGGGGGGGGVGGGTVGWRAPECFDSLEAREVLGPLPVQPSGSDPHGSESSLWPPLRSPGNCLDDEPSPYVSRGTRSRLRHMTMAQATAAAAAASPQLQLQSSEGDEPDSAETNPTSTTDPAVLRSYTNCTGSRRRMTRAVDIFSMGCVFYYVLTDGGHPFGDRLSREHRILAGTPDLRALEGSDNPSAIEAVDLIAHMVARHDQDRPSAASVLVHPYFWDATQRLGFLQDVSDCLEAEARLIKVAREEVPEPPRKTKQPKKKGPPLQPSPPAAACAAAIDSSSADKPGSHALSNESIDDIIAQLPAEQAVAVRRAITLLDAFEINGSFVMEGPPPSADGFQVVGMPSSHSAAVDAMSEAVSGSNGSGSKRPRRVAWDRRLDLHLRRDLGKFRKYDGTRLRDLLRVIRNKKSHYQDMPTPLREALGDIPEGYLHYFESRFPYLLLHCYYFVLEDDSLRTATVFRPYFRPPAL
ncbi:bifunctional endoribonuclease/protein kinase ire1 [Coemansia thaxteri]|nr:bifunctional endoribonuclease/protein kinase ire1 [Coemansia thaxteri]